MTIFKITGDDFDDFAPAVQALSEDGMLRTAHLGDDDKDWVVTTDADVDKEAVQGVLDSVETSGTVKLSRGKSGDVEDESDAEDDDNQDDDA